MHYNLDSKYNQRYEGLIYTYLSALGKTSKIELT